MTYTLAAFNNLTNEESWRDTKDERGLQELMLSTKLPVQFLTTSKSAGIIRFEDEHVIFYPTDWPLKIENDRKDLDN